MRGSVSAGEAARETKQTIVPRADTWHLRSSSGTHTGNVFASQQPLNAQIGERYANELNNVVTPIQQLSWRCNIAVIRRGLCPFDVGIGL